MSTEKDTFRFLASDRAWGLGIAFFAAIAIFNSVLNSYYQSGTTDFDTTIFATVMWRNDILLHTPIVYGLLGNKSFFVGHLSPIFYIPNLLSYFFPGNRITFHALVYAVVYAALIYQVYVLVRGMTSGRWAACLAALAAFLFFCSQTVFQGYLFQRYELFSPPLALLAFTAWQRRNYRSALVWFLMNCAVREDLGVIFAIPLMLLAAAQYWRLRLENNDLAKERVRWAFILAGATVTWTMAAFTTKSLFFSGYDMFHTEYYGEDHPFSHLSADILSVRLGFLFLHQVGIWIPVIILGAAAFFMKDLQLLVGALAFVPYFVINFFSKSDMGAMLINQKSFPFHLVMIWPAVAAIVSAPALRKKYLVLQFIVLISGLAYINRDVVNLAMDRWTAHDMTPNAAIYQEFGAGLNMTDLSPPVRVSEGVIHLYPYHFPPWYLIDLSVMTPADEKSLNTLLWFEGGRDLPITARVLSTGEFTTKAVPGTKIRISVRTPAKTP